MWRVPSERITLDLDGPSVEVERISSWAIKYQGLALTAAFNRATGADAEYRALVPLTQFFVGEAQPTWEIIDHRGPIPPTPEGMLRLPIKLAGQIIEQWLDTLIVPDASLPESAVDAVIPDGPVNLEIKRRLRKKKAA